MKKTIAICLYFLFTTSVFSAALTRVNIVDIKNSELDIILDLNLHDSSFTEYYSFQYNPGNDFDFFSGYSSFFLLNATSTLLTIKADNDTLFFALSSSSRPNTYLGFGISKSYAKQYVLTLVPAPASFLDLIKINGQQVMKGDISCDSGGEGASSCSTDSSPIGSAGCSVTCKDGYYACCDKDNICRCIKEGGSKKIIKASYNVY
mgnify:CR=1 FL=1